MAEKITYPDMFMKICDEFFYSGKLNQSEEVHQRIITTSATDYALQKPLAERKFKESTEFGGSLISLIDLVEKVHRNLNYRKGSVKLWEEFYTFPLRRTTAKYAKELCGIGEKPSSITVVNKDTESVDEYVENIISSFKNEECEVSFLNGTTGVGKTTFLKYLVKTRKAKFLRSNVVISRIKYRFIEEIYDSKPDNSENLQSIVARNIIDCLFRDIIDSCYIAKERPDEFDKDTKENLDILLETIIEEIKAEDIQEHRFDEVAFSKHEDRYLQTIPKHIKSQAIVDANSFGLKFCIILDGFDAMRPEEIRLLNEKKEVDFLKCLSSLIRNAIASGTPDGQLIHEINKALLVAARPITIMQLKAPIQPDTDWDHHIDSEVFVVGSDIFRLLENRIKVLFKLNGKPDLEPDDKIFSAIEAGIKTIIGEIYSHHKSIERGRFVDLFNHNIRQKLVFLGQCIQYYVQKVEAVYAKERFSKFNPTGERLNTDMFAKYSKYSARSLHINLYEVQKLLILPKEGKFKNHFKYDAVKDLLPEEDTGPFDNIFNYLRYENLVNYEKAKESKWSVSFDRIFIKILCLRYLNENRGKAPYRAMKSSIESDFKNLIFDNLDAKVLMRSGLIRMDLIDGDQWIEITRKGKFILQELLNSSIYIEHALLNCRVPYYINQAISPPLSNNRREWALYSIVNSVIFLKYLKHTALHSENKTSKMEDFIINIYEAIKPSFKGVIIEGINELGNSFRVESQTKLLQLDAFITR